MNEAAQQKWVGAEQPLHKHTLVSSMMKPKLSWVWPVLYGDLAHSSSSGFFCTAWNAAWFTCSPTHDCVGQCCSPTRLCRSVLGQFWPVPANVCGHQQRPSTAIMSSSGWCSDRRGGAHHAVEGLEVLAVADDFKVLHLDSEFDHLFPYSSGAEHTTAGGGHGHADTTTGVSRCWLPRRSSRLRSRASV